MHTQTLTPIPNNTPITSDPPQPETETSTPAQRSKASSAPVPPPSQPALNKNKNKKHRAEEIMRPPPVAAAVAAAAAGPPRRLLFIASIGNQGPYRRTRHSAGHILLDELLPQLRARWNSDAQTQPQTQTQTPPIGAYYTTWYSPSFMNESGPKLVRQMVKSFGRQDEVLGQGPALSPWLAGLVPGATKTQTQAQGYPATLVILHDELEAPLGKVRVKRGGPEVASLRGHRGLISVCESLRGKGLYPAQLQGQQGQRQQGRKGGKEECLPRDLSILRVGVGIGRPDSRAKNAVADYVLAEMDAVELAAVKKAVEPVMGVLEEELYRV
ncbi:hypothetical protein N7466_006911 [Penicillium verhagenii]|uniref:uncharacterized protein n=1 Tax=Penicillium verhagenii TaxID=1562060 RepID=UPI00254500AE|nr:uncharacterized protein N7466_006911 [Penicillium verhagenii]KAJ5927955.1 hypothetical protein N7466_006911 [Penicillium verhagenii]